MRYSHFIDKICESLYKSITHFMIDVVKIIISYKKLEEIKDG